MGSTKKLWKRELVVELREKLADIERHMYAHAQTNGKTLVEVVSEDESYVITHSLMSVKVYMYSVVNMSSPFFRADDKTPETVNDQIAELISVVASVKIRLDNCGVHSDVVDKGTTTFYNTVSTLSPLFRDDKSLPADNLLRENVQVFRRVLNLAEDLRRGDNGAVRAFDDDDIPAGTSKSKELFALIPAAAKVLMEERVKRGGTQDDHLEDLRQLQTLWAGWQISKHNITYEYDEFEERISLGYGATAVVYAGLLQAG